MSPQDPAIYRNGYRYLPVKIAAKNVGLVSDYVSRMCREKTVRAIKHAGIWHVDPESLSEFLAKQSLEYEHFKRRKSLLGKAELKKHAHTGLRDLAQKAKRFQTLGYAGAMLVPVLILFFFFPVHFQSSKQVAAAGSGNIFSSIGDALFTAFCPLFQNCPASNVAISNPTPTPSPTPVPQSATPSPVTPPSPAPVITKVQPPSTITQVTHERVIDHVTVERVVSEGGISESLLNSRLALLQTTLESEIKASSIAYSPDTSKIYQAISVAGGGGGSSVTNITNNTDAAALTGGVVAIAHGGTATSTAPTYGELLMGDGAGGYSLVSTSSLNIVGAASSPGGASGSVQFNNAGTFAGASLLFYDNATGRLGVGTTSPAATIGVQGNAYIGGNIVATGTLTVLGATSTYANGIDIAQGCFSVNGVCVGGNSSNGFSTTSADFWQTQRNYFSTTSASYFLAMTDKGFFFSTTSADYWKTANNFFSTTSASYWANATNLFSTTSADYFASQRNFFATTSADYHLSLYDKGFFFSTTSASYFLSQQNVSGFATTSADYWQTQRNFFSTSSASFWASGINFFSTTSADYLASQRNYFSTSSADYYLSLYDKGFFFSTTSADNWKLANNFFSTSSASFWASGLNFFSTTSADYLASQRNFFSTTSASYFADASTTIPKTYTNNTFAGTQTFLNASTTNISALYASTTLFYGASLSVCEAGNFLTWSSGQFGCSTDQTGSTFAYLFPSNATTTLLNFNAGITAYASSTIGGGTQASGLTINGGATTTGNAYVASNMLIGSSSLATSNTLSVQNTSSGNNIINLFNSTGLSRFSVNDAGSVTTGNISAAFGNVAINSGGVLIPTSAYFGFSIFSKFNYGGVDGAIKLSNGAGTSQALLATANNNFGVGTTSPYASFSLVNSVETGGATPLFVVASTSGGTATTTLFSISNTGLVTGGNFSMTNSTTTSLAISNLSTQAGQCLTITASGDVTTQSCTTGNFAYLFPSNATTTLLNFNGGLTAYASTTIGDGTQAGGLTISGGATTTGNMYLGGILNIVPASSNATSTLIQFNGQDFVIASSSGTGNLGIGVGALAAENSNAAGFMTQRNLAFGYQALNNLNNSGNATYGINNVAIGYQAGISAGRGWQNVAIGTQALTGFTTSSGYSPANNIAIGYQSLYRIQTGNSNTCIGTSACLSVTTGTDNFALGTQAYLNNSTGIQNEALGSQALNGLGTGKSYNIGLGYKVGANTNANNDILIGTQIDAGALTTDSQLNIGNFLYAGSIGSSSIAWTGTSGVGTSSPWARLSIQANNRDTNTTLFAIGSSTASATTTLFSISNTGVLNLNPYQPDNDLIATLNGNKFISASSTTFNTTVGILAGANIISTSTSITSGLYNTALGYQALQNSTSSDRNTAVGYQALKNVSASDTYPGSDNSAFGFGALLNNTFGGANSAFGAGALAVNTTGLFNTAMGYSAAYVNRTGISNTAIGSNALYNNVTGSSNVAIGGGDWQTGASFFNGSATNTVAVGYRAAAGSAAYSAQGYTILGHQAGQNITTGADYNTLLGYQAGNSLTSGGYNTAIGQNVDLPSNTASRQLNVGNILFGTNLYNGATVSAAPVTNGNLGVGTTSPFAQFAIHAVNGSTNPFLFAVGSSTASATTTLFSINNTGQVGIGISPISSVFGLSVSTGIYSDTGIWANAGNVTQSMTDSNVYAPAADLSVLGGVGFSATNNSGTNGDFSGMKFTVRNAALTYQSGYLGFVSNSAGYTPDLVIGQQTGASTYTERLRINSSGNLGIGTTSPFAQFSIATPNSASGSVTTLFTIGSSTASATTSLYSVSNIGVHNFNLDNSTSTLMTLGGRSMLLISTSSSNLFGGNTALGLEAYAQNTTGYYNTAIGYQALTSNTADTGNTAIGYRAMSGITSGYYNVAIGPNAINAAVNNTRQNIGIGGNTLSNLKNNLGVNDNIAVGYQALAGNNSQLFYGSNNIALGSSALFYDINSYNSIGVGSGSLKNLLYSSSTIAIGINAGYGNAAGYAGSFNTLVGDSAGYTFTSGANYNTLLGFGAGYNLTSGANNILIGSLIDAASSTGSNQLNIGNVLYGSNLYNSTTFATSSSPVLNGAIGIGTSTPWGKLSISANNGDTNTTLFAIGSSTASATTTLFSVKNTGMLSLNLDTSSSTIAAFAGQIFLTASTTGFNTGLGLGANGNITTATQNSAFGYQALGSVTSSASNSAFGYRALASITNNFGNGGETAFGANALTALTTGVGATAVGYNALQSVSTGSNNTAVGSNALQGNGGSSYSNNTGVGASVLSSNQSGSYNTAMGVQAAKGNGAVSFSGVTAIGYGAGSTTISGGNYNSFFGYQSGLGITTGYGNTLLGTFDLNNVAGASVTTGSGNISLGYNAFFPSATANSQLNIGNILFGTLPATTTGFLLPTAGTLGIGTGTPFGKFAISLNNGDGSFFNNAFVIASSTGSATTTLFMVANTGEATLGGNSAGINVNGPITGTGAIQVGAGSSLNWAGRTKLSSSGDGALAITNNSGSLTQFAITSGGNVGVGTSTPFAKFSISANTSDTNTTLFAISSSTASATSTLFSISNTGNVVSTLAASSSFIVGANGATNPAFQIFASTTNAVTGLQIVSNLAGNGVTLQTTSSAADEALTIASKGAGAVNINSAAGVMVQSTSNGSAYLISRGNNSTVIQAYNGGNGTQLSLNGNGLFTFTEGGRNLTASPAFYWNPGGNNDTNLTATTEVPEAKFDFAGHTVAHANSAIALQRAFLVTQPSEQFSSYSTGNSITDLAAFSVAAPSYMSRNGTTTNAYALLIGSSTPSTMLDASTTNSYGLAVFTSAGARNTYSAIFQGGNVGIGTTTPGTALDIANGALCVDDATPTCGDAARTAGTIYAVANSITGIDLAERYPTKDVTLMPGEIVGFDPSNPVFVSRAASSSNFLGVVSTAPGIELGGYNENLYKNEKKVPIALAGRVPVKVNLDGGIIYVGDAITISATAGIGAKATTSTQTIGIALEPYDGTGTSTIQVFIKPELTLSTADLASIIATAATATPQELVQGPLSSASENLRSAISDALTSLQNIAQTGVRKLGDAVYASVGVFDKVFTKELRAQNVFADEVHTDKLCVGNVCVTEAQFLNMVQAASAGATSAPQVSSPPPSSTSTPDTADTTPPTISVNGNNPASIDMGASYVDLGATVTDNVDQNIGYTALVDGGVEVSPDALSIDTSVAGSHTITYKATDQAGNTSTAVRTLVVQDPNANASSTPSTP